MWAYVRKHKLAYNPLLDKGFASVGDTFSTAVAAPKEGERAGRVNTAREHAREQEPMNCLGEDWRRGMQAVSGRVEVCSAG